MSSIPRGTGRPPTSAPFSANSPTARAIALGLIVVGLILTIGALLADPLGITWGGDGFGWKQLIAAILGLVLAILGAGLLLRGVAHTPYDPFEPIDSPE